MYRSYFALLPALFFLRSLVKRLSKFAACAEIQVPEKIGSISSDPLPSSTAVPSTASKQECLGKDTQEHSPSSLTYSISNR